ncbi:MAG: F0F1 ATP synthase subunit alpha [Lentisphaeria bacterium]|nr:F0F1 ATP synthase subunit alpha [Lentisphaeria bacterium]
MPLDTIQIHEVGEVREVRKDIAKITGLNSCMIGEIIEFTPDSKGMIFGFEEGAAFAFLLGKVTEVKVGGPAYSALEPFNVPAGEAFVGRMVNALAEPLDSKGEIAADVNVPIFREAPGVLERVPISRVLETGILSLDTTIPIGKGQRELIIGDRMTGKTTVCVDTILNQKGKDVICIYCCIGRSNSSLRRVVETLNVAGAMDYTIVVSATGSCCSGEQYLAPYTAAALGEYFMDRGRDVYVVFDDLTKHAWAYRQISLLLERPPGRECYPGDVFYLHSQLMERAGQFSPEMGGGSMTFFPIVDTLQGDVTGFIPSNLVSMTDGQIYMGTNLFNSGFRPAIDLGLSVSRIGSKVQGPMMKKLSSMLRLEYVQYVELLKKTRFSAGVTDELRERLRPGEILTRLFTQDAADPYRTEKILVFLHALKQKFLHERESVEIERFKSDFVPFLSHEAPEVVKAFTDQKPLSAGEEEQLERTMEKFFA